MAKGLTKRIQKIKIKIEERDKRGNEEKDDSI